MLLNAVANGNRETRRRTVLVAEGQYCDVVSQIAVHFHKGGRIGDRNYKDGIFMNQVKGEK